MSRSVHVPWIEIDGRQVHFTARPGGPQSIVFLHGGFGSSSDLWAETMEALPPTWSGYAIDNFLYSDPPPDGYSVEAFSRRAAGFADALGLRRPVFAGHSMGGVVCQLTGINRPDLVGGLVLVCTGPSMTNHAAARRWLGELKAGAGSPDSIRAISANWFHGTPPRASFERYVGNAVRAPLDAMISVQESLIAADLRDALPRIEAPTLVVFGAHDAGRTIEHAQALLGGIRHSTLAIMRDSGHTPMVETPTDFNAALHAFLSTFAPVPA
jgi:pimeloyl-ACP methyl ester carboxylesterase